MVFEAAFIGVRPATDGALVLFVRGFLDVVFVVSHVVVEVGHLSKGAVTTIKTTSIGLLTFNMTHQKYKYLFY